MIIQCENISKNICFVVFLIHSILVLTVRRLSLVKLWDYFLNRQR